MSDQPAALKVIDFLAAIREGEEQTNQSKVIPLDQLEENLQTWLSNPRD